MTGRNWDAELAKIDRALEHASDEALLPAKSAPTAAARAAAVERQRTTSTLGVMARLVLSLALALAMPAWPYGTRCGVPLFGYLGGALLVAGAGVWTAVWSWRHRSGRAHFVAILLLLWGLGLAAAEVLPRVGYTRPGAARTWLCGPR